MFSLLTLTLNHELCHHIDDVTHHCRHKRTMFSIFGGLVAPPIVLLGLGINLHVFSDIGINYVRVLLYNL
jgi:hypothetical protein